MPYTQLSQSNPDNLQGNKEQTMPVDESMRSLADLKSGQAADDILSRMDRLRALASMQQNKSRSNKRQQYSFCF